MLRYLKQLKTREKLIWGLFLSIVVLVVPLSSYAYTVFFTEGFETYNLGNLNGQQGWVATNGTVGDRNPPYEYQIKEGEKSVYQTGGNQYKYFDNNSNGILSFWGWYSECAGGIYFKGNEHLKFILVFRPEGESCILKDYPSEGEIREIELNQWQNIQVRWINNKYQANVNDTGWVAERNFMNSDEDYLDYFQYNGVLGYFDDFSGVYVPPSGRVWSVSPASETEITNLDDIFAFAWENLEGWDSLSVAFQNKDTGIFSNANILETISPSGQESFSFESFNFDRNGKYYFYAVATKWSIEFIEGMYITGNYSYQWSDDLVSPVSWFTINTEGYTPIFEMSDFSTWYGEVSKFATPTDMFVSIAGFFEPTFNKIGEFGNRIKDYFNLSEVYSQGYEIGKVIPYFSYFVGQISLFLGGFPILKWVFVVIILLTGIFIFRLVMKFIPFLGGS